MRVFRLHVIYPPAHEVALNKKQIAFKVEIIPLQRRDLAYAKADALGNNHHRAVRLFDLRHDGLEPFRSKNSPSGSGRIKQKIRDEDLTKNAMQCLIDQEIFTPYPVNISVRTTKPPLIACGQHALDWG
jgi:hypothetical protein